MKYAVSTKTFIVSERHKRNSRFSKLNREAAALAHFWESWTQYSPDPLPGIRAGTGSAPRKLACDGSLSFASSPESSWLQYICTRLYTVLPGPRDTLDFP